MKIDLRVKRTTWISAFVYRSGPVAPVLLDEADIEAQQARDAGILRPDEIARDFPDAPAHQAMARVICGIISNARS